MSEQPKTLKIHRLPFTQVPNDLICSDKISGMAKALWCVFYSKPDNWIFFWREIEGNFKEGRDAVRKAADQLEELGYLKRTQKKINSGKGMVFGGMEIELFSYPNQQIHPSSSNTENPYSRNSDTSISDTIFSNTRNTDTYKEIKNKDLPKKDLSNIKKPKTNFSIPVDEELKIFFKDFCSEWEEFKDHFESNGWKVGGKTPMNDWKAAARNWERRHKKYNPDAKPKNQESKANQNIEKLRRNLESHLRFSADYLKYFAGNRIEEKDNKYLMYCDEKTKKESIKYKEILDQLNIEIQLNQ